jgi:alkylated DNA repair dioxygenase AlkB
MLGSLLRCPRPLFHSPASLASAPRTLTLPQSNPTLLVHPSSPVASGEHCLVAYLPNVLTAAAASQLLRTLLAECPWQREVDAFGPQSRLTAYFGDADCVFSYVGLTLQPTPWTPALSAARDTVCALLSPLGAPGKPTACLLNNYEPGEGSIVYHSDEVCGCRCPPLCAVHLHARCPHHGPRVCSRPVLGCLGSCRKCMAPVGLHTGELPEPVPFRCGLALMQKYPRGELQSSVCVGDWLHVYMQAGARARCSHEIRVLSQPRRASTV